MIKRELRSKSVNYRQGNLYVEKNMSVMYYFEGIM